MENPFFFLKGDKWVGTGTDKKCLKLVCNDLKIEKGHLVNWWERLSLGGEQALGRKRQHAQDKGLTSRFWQSLGSHQMQ